MTEESPPLNPADLPFLVALCIQFHREWVQADADEKLMKAAEARLKVRNAQLDNLLTTAKAYGVAASGPGWFGPIMDAVGQDEFLEAFRKAGVPLDEPSKVLPPPPEFPKETNAPALDPDASVRELVLEMLNRVGPIGARAADIQAHIEQLKRTNLHDKTIGMTLYRLSLAGKVRRDGRIWFSVLPDTTTQNPGDGTPGLFNRDNEEEDAS